MYYSQFVILCIIFILYIHLFLERDKIKFTNIFETIEFNYKLILNSMAGIFYNTKKGSYFLENYTKDQLLFKLFRRLNKKYGKIVLSYILFHKPHYLILDNELSKQILRDSPIKFSAGDIKYRTFNKIMKNNVGNSKCEKNSKCPWKEKREYNEVLLGTNKTNDIINYIPKLIKTNIISPLLNFNDFNNFSFKITSLSIFGDTNCVDVLGKFMKHVVKGKNVYKSDFFNTYKHKINNRDSNNICILNNNKYNKLDFDQIPHCFIPLISMISFLIPHLLCIILNFDDIYNKIKKEISDNNFNIFSKNTYLHYCVIEHIRLFNTVNVNMQRSVNYDMEYEGYNFKKGDNIFILFSNILRNENDFLNPDNFIPERWENKSIEDQYIVFGVGPQRCPSINMTPLYYKSIISNLLSKYNYKCNSPILNNKNIPYINPYLIHFSII